MTLVEDARSAWKWLSVWAFVILGAMPDIYSGVQALGWLEDKAVPPAFIWTIRIGAAIGIALRLISQKAKEQP
jgi:hypothetical protein